MEDVLIFREILRKYAQNGNIFSLDEAAVRLTMDVIGKVVLLVFRPKGADSTHIDC